MNQNTGHGHVFPRPDGAKARCGGPGLCKKCSADLAKRQAVFLKNLGEGINQLKDMLSNLEKSSKLQHLRYDMNGAPIEKHAQEVMRDLGITYVHATPQSMGDCWWFWGCSNVPDPMPDYLSPLNVDPMECIGWGLSEESAKKIVAAMENQ